MVASRMRQSATSQTTATTCILVVSNVAPTVTLGGRTAANEGETYTYTFTTHDPGPDTFALVSIDAGPDATVANQVFDPLTGTGSFDCNVPRWPKHGNHQRPG